MRETHSPEQDTECAAASLVFGLHNTDETKSLRERWESLQELSDVKRYYPRFASSLEQITKIFQYVERVDMNDNDDTDWFGFYDHIESKAPDSDEVTISLIMAIVTNNCYIENGNNNTQNLIDGIDSIIDILHKKLGELANASTARNIVTLILDQQLYIVNHTP